MTNYAFCRCNERPSIWERVHPFIIIFFFFFFSFLPRQVFSAASSLLLFFALRHVHTRGLHQACLSPLGGENDVTALFGLAKEMQRRYTISCAVKPQPRRPLSSWFTRSSRISVWRNNKKKIKRASSPLFPLLSPPSLDLSDLPEIFNALAYTGIYSSLSHFVARQGHWWTRGLDGNPRRFKKIAVRDRTYDQGVFPQNEWRLYLNSALSRRKRTQEDKIIS